jgi:hypothetical protein
MERILSTGIIVFLVLTSGWSTLRLYQTNSELEIMRTSLQEAVIVKTHRDVECADLLRAGNIEEALKLKEIEIVSAINLLASMPDHPGIKLGQWLASDYIKRNGLEVSPTTEKRLESMKLDGNIIQWNPGIATWPWNGH